MSAYENSFLFSRDESNTCQFYIVIFTLESGERKQDDFCNYGKQSWLYNPWIYILYSLLRIPPHTGQLFTIYGSVYSALKEILDGKTVDRIYENIPEFTPLSERINIVDEEQFVIKCGNNSCVHLDWEFKFKNCSRCNLRRYCGPNCQKLNWKLHKKECFLCHIMKNIEEEVDQMKKFVSPGYLEVVKVLCLNLIEDYFQTA